MSAHTQKDIVKMVQVYGKCYQCIRHPLAPVDCPHVIKEPTK